MSQLVAKAKQSTTEKPTILVVDDKYAKNLQRQQSIVNSIAMPGLNTRFVGSCEEAIEAFKQEANIVLCFLDCMLPESKDTTSNYNPERDGDIRGIEIINTIIRINQKILIVIYSAYVDEPQLREKVSQYKNVIDYFKKEKSASDFHIFVFNALKKLDLDLNLNELSQTSKKQVERQSYDYNQLNPEVRLLIQQRTEQIKRLVKRSTQDIVDIGKYLTEVKQNLKHGQFYPWLQSEFEWSLRTAVRFMKVYDKFKSVNLADLDLTPSVLYELSANTVPDAAIEETIELAESGETVTIESAKSIKEKYQKQKEAKDTSTNPGKIELDTSTNTKRKISNSTIDYSSEKNNTSDAENSFTKQNIIKVISPPRLWHLGKQKQHTVFCQDPNSTNFIKQLPSSIALCLAFPPTKHWRFEYDRYKSINTFYSEYQDLDEIALFKSIQHTIEITTEERDIIVVCYIPSLKILSLIDVLGCRAMIAEPNRDKCLGLIEKSKDLK